MAALCHLVETEFHIVAQIIEAELVVRAIGDICGIGDAPLFIRQAVDDHTNGKTKKIVNLAHPFCVASGEVIVDRDDMHALSLKGIEIDGKGGDQRLSFAGFHLGDFALVQNHAADQLHIEMTLAKRPLGRLTNRRKGFGQEVVQGFAIPQTLFECRG